MRNFILSKKVFVFSIVIVIIFFGVQLKPIIKKNISNLGYNAFGQRTSHLSALFNYYKAISDINKDENLHSIEIYIKEKHQNKIIKKRNESIDVGVLVKHKKDRVPARINNKNGKIRLKGDWTGHLEHTNKWSYRIKLDNGTLFNMDEFSIQHPKQREFQAEPIFFSMLRDLGVIAPKYFFAAVNINGENLGIMAVEQHFSNKMLEYNNREPGVILKFNEELLWDARVKNGSSIYEDFRNSEIHAFGMKDIQSDNDLLDDFKTGKGLLSGFVTGLQSPHDVFDAEKMGIYLAVVDVFGARHALYWHNLRFYVSPETGKLEPIAFDASMDYREGLEDRSTEKEEFSRVLMADNLIFQAYLEALKDIQQYLSNNSSIFSLDEKLYSELVNEFYYVPRFDFSDLKYRSYQVMLDTVQSLQYDKRFDIVHTDLLISSLESDKEDINKIILQNISPFSIKVLGVIDEAGKAINFVSNEEIIFVNGKSKKTLKMDLNYPIDRVTLNYRIAGQDHALVEKISRH
jgi:hypothetical protein